VLQGTIHLLTRLCTTWAVITIGAQHVLVRRLPPTMVTVILPDSSDLLWVTIAEQINVTRSRSPGVPGYSVSPIPISNIRVRLLELRLPIMQNVSMMSGRLLLNIMILRRVRRQKHVSRRFPVPETRVTEAVRVRRAVAGLARNGQVRSHMVIAARRQIILEREWAIITIVVILTGSPRFGATPWMRARDGIFVIQSRHAPTNTRLVALSGRSFTARVDGHHGWRQIARSHALLAPNVLVLDETDQ